MKINIVMQRIKNIPFHIAAILFVLIVFSSQHVLAAELRGGVTHLTQKEFMEKAKDSNVVVIDVRTTREYRTGYIEGAINHPHKTLLKDVTLLDQYAGKDLIFYCHSGIRVKIITDYVRESKKVKDARLFHLKGDTRAWRARKLPLVKPS